MNKKKLEELSKKLSFFDFILDEKGNIKVKKKTRFIKSFEKQALEFSSIIMKARQELLKKLSDEISFNLKSQKDTTRILDQLENSLLKDVNKDTKKFFEKEFKSSVNIGLKRAFEDIKRSAYKTKDVNLNNLDKNLINLIFSETMEDMALRTQQIGSQTKRFIRNTAQQALSKASLKGEGFAKVYKEIQDKFSENAEFAFIDNAGRKWQGDTYAKMLTRTKLRDVQETVYQDKLVENGIDLIVVDNNGENTCESCLSYSDSILSLSGTTAGFETWQEARNKKGSHLAGPNCNCTTRMFDSKGYALDFNIDEQTVVDLARQYTKESEVIQALINLGEKE